MELQITKYAYNLFLSSIVSKTCPLFKLMCLLLFAYVGMCFMGYFCDWQRKLAATKASEFFFIVYALPPSILTLSA